MRAERGFCRSGSTNRGEKDIHNGARFKKGGVNLLVRVPPLAWSKKVVSSKIFNCSLQARGEGGVL